MVLKSIDSLLTRQVKKVVLLHDIHDIHIEAALSVGNAHHLRHLFPKECSLVSTRLSRYVQLLHVVLDYLRIAATLPTAILQLLISQLGHRQSNLLR